MKVTIIRTDSKNIPHVSIWTIERLMEHIMADNSKGAVAQLRRQLPLRISYGWDIKELRALPRVYPAVVMGKSSGGDILFRQWNGVVLLTVGGLADREQVEQAKALAFGLPSTMAAFAGSSGRTVKLLVCIAADNGMEPTTEDEADRLYRAGYHYAVQVYRGLFADRMVEQEPGARASFRMTLDSRPLLRTTAVPLTVGKLTAASLSAPSSLTSGSGWEADRVTRQRKMDFDKYNDYEYLYRRAAGQVWQEMGSRFDGDPHADDAFMTELVRRLRQLGFPEEEAVLHTRSHLWTRQEDEHIRAIVGSVYAEASDGTDDADVSPAVRIRRSQQEMMAYLETRYVFRYNEVMGYAEYRPNNTWVHPYMPVDERVQNQMAIECRLAGLDVWDKDIQRFIRSSYVPTYNPVGEYLDKCRGKWDGCDRIRELARMVPTRNPHWVEWFYTWFLGMVRQWQSTIYDRYGNQVAPLLISRQGWNKSTFIQSLLPPELQWGYTNQLDVSEKKQTLQAMSQFLLINLDEFNQISPTLQQGFLKNIITLPTVKVKRPYGKHIEPFPRLASFIGATNQTDVLADPSGGRRFLGVELTGPIDVSHLPNHEQLFAQALQALDSRERYYFDEEQTQQILESNRQFQQHTPAELFFHDVFEAAADATDGKWLSASAIFSFLRKQAGSSLCVSSLNHFGRTLANIPGIERKRTSRGTEYLVKLRK